MAVILYVDWYYAIKDRQLGPVSGTQLEDLRRQGMIDEDTLVWRSGMSDWQTVRSTLPPLLPTAADDQLCSECRKFFPVSELIQLNRAWVCEQCKPLYLQRLSEGTAPPAGVGQFWRDKRLLVFNVETPFPDRCIHCNQPAKGYRMKCDVQWVPVGSFIVFSRKRHTLHVGLCPRHRTRRRSGLIACGVLVLLGIGMLVFGSAWSAIVAGCGVPVIMISVITAAHFSSPLAATKAKEGVIWLRGAGKPFLAEHPQWTDSS